MHHDVSAVAYDNALSREFAKQYAGKFEGERQFVNHLFLSPVYRIAGNGADRIGLRLARGAADTMARLRKGAVEELQRVSVQLWPAPSGITRGCWALRKLTVNCDHGWHSSTDDLFTMLTARCDSGHSN